MAKHVQPELNLRAYNCPLCGAFATQSWEGAYLADHRQFIQGFYISQCTHCNKRLFWYEGEIIVPRCSTAPLSHESMPEDVRADYDEARAVFASSPRASAALLRLATQKLCIALGLPGRNLNDDIAELVRRGLPAQAQKAFDFVRVVGNNQVHPGILDVRDEKDIAVSLFDLVNLIVEVLIAQPQQMETLFAKLPESARKAIQERDANAATQNT
jgi:hypothetical protein